VTARPGGTRDTRDPVDPVHTADVAVDATGAGRPAALIDLVAERSIIVCCGSGGVGKTTTAAVVALEGARLGRKTVVVTIDPAKRLADALGLQGLTDTPSRIDGDWPGELWATMLDTKSTFDALVVKHAATPEQGGRILANGFYRNISGALSGTQEYMAMEKLYELHDETDFDLVVVDTPPTRHALDFLDAPRRLSRFLEHRLFRLLVAPSRGLVKAVNVAAQTFLRTVSKVVGGDVVDDAIAFFQAFEGMEEGFRRRAARVNELLAAPETAFVLVASPRRDTVGEAHFFADRLHEAGISVQGLVVNRVHPSFGAASGATAALGLGAARRAETLAGTDIGGFYRNLAQFQAVAGRERAHLAGLADTVAPAPVAWVPFLRSDVHDIAGLDAVAGYVFSRPG
jgi:anion-transporting  ArsA/GET3 family ATPase